MINYFSSKVEFHCNLGEKRLIDLFKKWDKEKKLSNSYSYDYYYKRIFDNNSLVLNRFVGKVHEAQDVFMNYNKESQLLSLEIKPVVRAYALFLIVPMSVLVLLGSENVENRFWLIPVISLFLLICFFKWIVNVERKKIITEVKKVLTKEKIKHTIV